MLSRREQQAFDAIRRELARTDPDLARPGRAGDPDEPYGHHVWWCIGAMLATLGALAVGSVPAALAGGAVAAVAAMRELRSPANRQSTPRRDDGAG